jgi:hypothetical protein
MCPGAAKISVAVYVGELAASVAQTCADEAVGFNEQYAL